MIATLVNADALVSLVRAIEPQYRANAHRRLHFPPLVDFTARDCSACEHPVDDQFRTSAHNIRCATDGERSYAAAWTTGRATS